MCDTFVALQNSTADGSVIFGKNSDREPNEAQILEYIPAQFHSQNAVVKCTYLEIPQVKETKGVLLSRPFWMWGAEIAANEDGVTIGNEAVWTKMPLNKGAALTGMDLFRLGAERADSAIRALEVITELLEEYGQGGVCGYTDSSMVYHNSYIIADPKEAWVLETAGNLWAAKKIDGFYTISNGLTIGEEFDLSPPDLISFAKKKGWHKKGIFNFRKSYSDWLYTTFSGSGIRREQSSCLLSDSKGLMDVSHAMQILRDHRSEKIDPYKSLISDTICAHAGNGLTRNASQTTGSLIAHLQSGTGLGANTYWTTGTSAPCTGIFKPIWIHGEVLPDTGPDPAGQYNFDSLWWHHEMLHRSVLMDYGNRLSLYSQYRNELERSFFDQDFSNKEHLSGITENAFTRARQATEEWISIVQSQPASHKTRFIYNRYWKKINKLAGIMVN